MAFVIATSGIIGVDALYFFVAWLIGGASSTYLSERKGYGSRPGLATGLILTVAGTVIWLLIPARDGSDWKLKGPWGDELRDKHSAPPPAPAASDS